MDLLTDTMDILATLHRRTLLRRKNNYPWKYMWKYINHRGAGDGRSTTKGDGDGEV
jgi:hypothetical protein